MRILKDGTRKASNFEFSPLPTPKALSYGWWVFVRDVPGIGVVFNDYPYSSTTRRHQSKARDVMAELGITPALTLASRMGLQNPMEAMLDATRSLMAERDNLMEELASPKFAHARSVNTNAARAKRLSAIFMKLQELARSRDAYARAGGK